MARVLVSMDVSQLSGWLNADATCRVEGRACAIRDEVRAGRREGVGVAAAHPSGHAREGPTQGLGARARAERTANM